MRNGREYSASLHAHPATSMSTVLTSPLAGLWRLSQEDITQIAMAMAGLIQPQPLLRIKLSSSLSSNPMQVSSSSVSSGIVDSTLPSLTMLLSHPGTTSLL